MAITMTNYGLTWTDPSGKPRAAASAYDEGSALRRKEQPEEQGCTDVEVVKVKPGELPKAG